MRDKKLILLMPLRSVLFILVFVVVSAITGKQLPEISSIWSVTASLINISLVLALVMITKKHGGFLRLINYEKHTIPNPTCLSIPTLCSALVAV